MADTATAEPEPALSTTETEGADTGEYTLQTVPQQSAEPVPERRSQSRGRPQAVPLLVHGTNATGIAVGVAYAAAGVPGLIAAGAAGAAVGAAALYGRRKRSKVSAARRAARAAAANRSGGAGGSGRLGGGGAGRGGLLGRTGRGNRSGGGGPSGRGSGGSRPSGGGTGSTAGRRSGGGRHAGPGSPGSGTGKKGRGLGGLFGRGRRGGGGAGSPGANTPKGTGGKNGAGQQSRTGKAWQTVKGWANKARRNKNAGAGSGTAGGSGRGSNGGSSGAAAPATTRRGRLLQKVRGWAGKLRRAKKGAASGGKPGAGKAGPASGRFYRMRRVVARKLGHWSRMAGAGLLAGLAGFLALPLGVLWGIWRTFTRHRDPLHAWAFPARTAGRIWRFFFRRSKARHDKEAQADQLNLTVNDPRKDTDPVSGPSLASGTAVLDGNNSKFALAMRAAHSTYSGYSPRSMMEVAAEYAGLPNGIRATAMAVQQMAVNSDQKFPCSKRAIAKLAEAAQRLIHAAARADGMVALFRTAHQFDIERIVAPRTNEWMWNVTPTGSAAPEGAMFMPGRIEAGCVLMAVLYRTFEPVHMMQVGSEYQGMAYGLNALADAIQVLHQRTRDLYPVDDRVTDELGTIVSVIRAAADDAAMAAMLFVEDHRLEISHNTNPRKGPAAEGMWNTPR